MCSRLDSRPLCLSCFGSAVLRAIKLVCQWRQCMNLIHAGNNSRQIRYFYLLYLHLPKIRIVELNCNLICLCLQSKTSCISLFYHPNHALSIEAVEGTWLGYLTLSALWFPKIKDILILPSVWMMVLLFTAVAPPLSYLTYYFRND